jgi:hypothetical protein
VLTFKKLRILFLLIVLFLVAAGSGLSEWRSTRWQQPLSVAIYPINGDGSKRSAAYIKGLSVAEFDDIERFFSEEAAQFQLTLKQPVDIVLGAALTELPPAPPIDRNVLAVVWWSLHMRYWAWQATRAVGSAARIKIFVLYHEAKPSMRLAHSLGLQKGLLGVVHAFAEPRLAAKNNVVIAHELLHTVGASDKYDPSNNRPLYPIGYAEPDKQPLLPQEFATLMAGRIAVSADEARQPKSLDWVIIGEHSAREIRWIE